MFASVPNLLTLSRLFALPLVIVLYRRGDALAAALLFAVAMITDCFDGWLARRLGQTSRLGLYLDPVVDKIVILCLFYELAWQRLLPMAIPHLFLIRELLQNGIRAAGAGQGRIIGANWMGKSKATLQNVLLGFGLGLPWLAEQMAPDSFARFESFWRLGCWAVLVLSWGFFITFLIWNRGLFAADRGNAQPPTAQGAA